LAPIPVGCGCGPGVFEQVRFAPVLGAAAPHQVYVSTPTLQPQPRSIIRHSAAAVPAYPAHRQKLRSGQLTNIIDSSSPMHAAHRSMPPDRRQFYADPGRWLRPAGDLPETRLPRRRQIIAHPAGMWAMRSSISLKIALLNAQREALSFPSLARLKFAIFGARFEQASRGLDRIDCYSQTWSPRDLAPLPTGEGGNVVWKRTSGLTTQKLRPSNARVG